MDFKPIPPSGKVEDLRNAPQAKTPEQLEEEKMARREKTRRNLRLIALVLAGYYFISAGYSWYQERQLEQQALLAESENPLSEPQRFRDTFNGLINGADTSLPTANANDTPDGFVAVLSPAVEIRGIALPNSRELHSLQIQTRYPDAFPPESLTAIENFILALERLADPKATHAEAQAMMRQMDIIPQPDANEDDKIFPEVKLDSLAYQYRTTFTHGPIDELTIIATPKSIVAKDQLTPGIMPHTSANSASAAPVAATPSASYDYDVPPSDEIPAYENMTDVPAAN